MFAAQTTAVLVRLTIQHYANGVHGSLRSPASSIIIHHRCRSAFGFPDTIQPAASAFHAHPFVTLLLRTQKTSPTYTYAATEHRQASRRARGDRKTWVCDLSPPHVLLLALQLATLSMTRVAALGAEQSITLSITADELDGRQLMGSWFSMP